jgi:hypothetical protein
MKKKYIPIIWYLMPPVCLQKKCRSEGVGKRGFSFLSTSSPQKILKETKK